ncbi:unnamed protein product [Parajaminaea phylloscopi]
MMAASAAQPALSVDVNLAHTQGRHPRQGNRALAHAARSAQAPLESEHAGSSSDDHDHDDAASKGSRGQMQRGDPRTHGLSSSVDEYNPYGAQGQDDPRQYHVELEGDRGQGMLVAAGMHEEEDEMDEEEEEEEEEEDLDDEDEDDDLSSSPSIPDENIDFELVYALHTFVATVEGQATVNKGNSLTLLDDSNSYWWLVRVLRTSEVGYIPAENIETPFERLARLNKHRNVDIASATDDDHIQVPSRIFSSHLVKRRDAANDSGLSAHSGKLSALSRREGGASPKGVSPLPTSKPSVIFGPCSYVEHSGDEYETDEEGETGDEDAEYEEYEEEDEEEDVDDDQVMDAEEEGLEENEQGDAFGHQGQGSDRNAMHSGQNRRDNQAQHEIRARSHDPSAAANSAVGSGNAHQLGSSNVPEAAAARKEMLAGMEPDDGMEWDAREAERIQSVQKANRGGPGGTPAQAGARPQMHPSQEPGDGSGSGPGQEHRSVNDQNVQQQRQMRGGPNLDVGQGRPAVQQRTSSQNAQDPTRRPSAERTRSNDNNQGAFYPSQVQAGRDRVVSDASFASSSGSGVGGNGYGAGGPYGRGSPTPQQLRKDKERRKSKNESFDASGDDSMSESGREGKKRSGVFSGLFSRNKDKKERKSGSFSSAGGGMDDSMLASRNSEDSNRAAPRGASPAASSTAAGSMGYGRGVQEKDRGAQEAYHRQFLSGSSSQQQQLDRASYGIDGQTGPRTSGGKPRPGSLMGTPGSVPMLNVVRVFAGDDINSDVTFKTVLLNQSTSTRDLVRQAMQRFRLNHGDYQLTVKLLEGSERRLAPDEKPLQVLDRLSEMAPEGGLTMPSVKRSSVGSISSISSNLSLNPAIVRANDDFSDDHAVKFYLKRASPHLGSGADDGQGRAGIGAGGNFASGNTGESQQSWQNSTTASSYSPLPGSMPGALVGPGNVSLGSQQNPDAALSQTPQARFALRLVIFPADLPEGLVFDPHTNALIPEEILAERGQSGSAPADGVESRFREKILSLPRNVTVAEVVEAGLDRFGIADGLVEGGDDVEDRTNRRRSKQRLRYGLAVDVKRQGPGQERHLAPNSRVLDAFPRAPIFKTPLSTKRRSNDSAKLLSMAEEQVQPTDPVFILRSVGPHGYANGLVKNGRSVRSLSPTEGRLSDKQDQRKQSEVAAAVSASSIGPDAARSREVIAAQRAAAQERKAAVLGAQRNDQQGVDLFLVNNGKIRSSRSLEGKVRYSYLPEMGNGQELDISAIVNDVLSAEVGPDDGQRQAQGPSPVGDSLKPHMPHRGASNSTLNSAYVSAPSSPMPEQTNAVAPLSIKGAKGPSLRADSSRDLLESFVRNPAASEDVIGDRIDQVLSRVAAGSRGADETTPKGSGVAGRSTPTGTNRSASGGTTQKGGSVGGSQGDVSDYSFSSMQDSTRSASASTEKSAGTNPTPLSTIGLPGGPAGSQVGAIVTGLPFSGASSASSTLMSRDSSRRMANAGPAAYIPSDDFGLDHLYTIVDAASRRDPRKYVTRMVSRSGSRAGAHGGNAGSGAIGGTATPPPNSAQSQSKNNSVVAVLTLAPEPENLRAQVAGLFPPSPPLALFSDVEGGRGASAGSSSNGGGGSSKVQQVYLPIERQLDRMEETLDALLADALRAF